MANLINPANLSPHLNPNSNFAVQESPESAARSKKYLVGLFFEILSVFSTITVGYEYFSYLTHSGSLQTVLILAAIFLVVHTMSFLLTKSRRRRLVVLLMETLGLLVFFVNFPGLRFLYYLGIVLVVFIFLIVGEHESRSTMDNAIKFKFRQSTYPLIGKIVSALVLMGVLLSLPQLQQDTNFFSTNEFYDISGWITTLTNKFYPGFSKDTAHDLARKLAEMQLEHNAVFQSLTETDRNIALDRAANEMVKNFAEQSNSSVEGTTPFSTIFTQYANTTLQGWYKRSPTVFLFIWAVVLFFIFRGFGAIVAIAIVFPTFLIYELLIATNVIHLVGESRLHESIEFS